jgi:hypothetical protein
MAKPMGYDYGFSRSLNGKSGTAGNGRIIRFYVGNIALF